MQRRILLVEDENDIAELVERHLRREGCEVERFADGEEAVRAARQRPPDVLILDIILPGLDGFEICKAFRRDPDLERVPILMLSARDEEVDIVTGLELGADDYLAKPFSPRVLVARVRNLLRRRSAAERRSPDGGLRVGDIEIDPDRHEARVGGEPLLLTRSEFRILHLLCGRPGRVRTRAEILDGVGGGPALERTVDVHIASLRRKLGPLGDSIETVRGVGYRLRE